MGNIVLMNSYKVIPQTVSGINYKPRVIRSKETIEEINEASQKRLKERKQELVSREKYLYGAPKLPKNPAKPFWKHHVESSPNFK